jgi:serine/threonine-protein kinase
MLPRRAGRLQIGDHQAVNARYYIQQKLGTGGMADVFLAVMRGPEGFQRPSVVKRIRNDLAAIPGFVQLFIDEASLSARLCHPNIVHVYDFGVMEGSHFIAMEQVPGRDLRWMLLHLQQRTVIPAPAVAAEIARQCCLALDYAHGLDGADGRPLNIVHRDVTPANIMVSRDGIVKLLDFGVARTLDPARRTHTDAGVIKGKLSYLAPEQLRDQSIDRRCDLFSLGTVLYELLSWRFLFRGQSDAETIQRVLEWPVPPPSTHNRAVSAVLDRIVMRALERDPDRRYQTAGEMADDLERYLLLSRHSGRVMRRLMRGVFEPIWRNSDGFDEPDTLLDVPPESDPAQSDATGDMPESSSPPPLTRSWQRVRRPLFAVAALTAAALLGTLVGARSLGAFGPESVDVSIDSVPQGAFVFEERASSPLGRTPLVVTLRRGQQPLSYHLVKDGHEPAAIKVIPDHEKPILVPLRAFSICPQN